MTETRVSLDSIHYIISYLFTPKTHFILEHFLFDPDLVSYVIVLLTHFSHITASDFPSLITSLSSSIKPSTSPTNSPQPVVYYFYKLIDSFLLHIIKSSDQRSNWRVLVSSFPSIIRHVDTLTKLMNSHFNFAVSFQIYSNFLQTFSSLANGIDLACLFFETQDATPAFMDDSLGTPSVSPGSHLQDVQDGVSSSYSRN